VVVGRVSWLGTALLASTLALVDAARASDVATASADTAPHDTAPPESQLQAQLEAQPNTALDGPTELYLKRTSSAELSFDETVRERLVGLSWHTNVGRVRLNANGAGLTYTPPEKQFPQVAIIGALDPTNERPLVHLIRLIGSPTIEVDSEPNVAVTVEILGTTFGPQPTDRQGNALVPIDVPPGIDSVTTFAKDAYGNVTRDELPLNAPTFPRILALCSDQEPHLYVVEVTRTGEPALEPSFSTSSPELSAAKPVAVAPGVFQVAFTQAPNTPPGTYAVHAQLDGATSTCNLTFAPPPDPLKFALTGDVLPVSPHRPWRLGATLGWITNGHRISGPWVSGRVSRSIVDALPGLRVEAEVGFSQSSSDLRTTEGDALDLTVQTVPLIAGARYTLDWGAIHPSIAVHGGAALTRASVTGTLVSTTDSFTTPWVEASVGAWWWLGRHELVLEAGYAHSKHDIGPFVGNVAGFKFVAGYQYGF
jgi:hypothetical protein